MSGWIDPGPYQRGRVYGKRLAVHQPHIDHEPAMRLDLQLIGTTNRAHRAFALGELRGYRQATGRPEPLYAHRVQA